MSVHSICPNCGAEDSLYQEVTLRSEAEREVGVAMVDGKPRVVFGKPETGVFPEVDCEQDIYCNACKETWADADDLVSGPPIEHRCESCDWWGFNPWQHGLERPDCPGEVRRREEIEAVPA